MNQISCVLVATEVYTENYGVYGVHKMCHALAGERINIGREQTARLMRLAGVSGKGKGRAPITTRKPKGPDTRPDLVQHEFHAVGPNWLWVADITYVRARKGFVYTVFVTDVFSRRIIGWAPSDSMRTEALPTSSQPGDCACEGNNGFYSLFRPRFTVREHCLQPAAG